MTVALKSGAAGADAPFVSDLSRLLEDVYGDGGPNADAGTTLAPRAGVVGADWSLDPSADEAPAGWAQDDETRVVGTTGDLDRSGGHPSMPTDGPPAWCRQDDDILPTGRGARRRGRSAAHASDPVTAPTPAVLSDEEPAPSRLGRLRRR